MGDNPLYLLVESLTDVAVIDLDEHQWGVKHEEILGEAISQTLVEKEGLPVLDVRTYDSSTSARYSSRVFSRFGGPTVRVYGFKISSDRGYEERWWLPWSGMIVSGKDKVSDEATKQVSFLSLMRSGMIPPA